MTSYQSITIEEAQSLISAHTDDICDDRLVPEPQISVCLVTFNHGRYIRQSVESALNQETTVPFEVVIGDDCSTDGTTDFVREIQKQHPEQVRLLMATRNLGQHTGNGRLNFVRTLRACRGKYIAMLDGDDMWTSVRKLQKQFDALEAHPEWAICFHRAQVIDERSDNQGFELPGDNSQETYALTDILSGNFMATATVMFRNGLIEDLPQWFYDVRFADWPLHVQNAQYGDIGFLAENMTVHRIHGDSTFSSMNEGARWKVTCEVFETMSRNLKPKYEAELVVARSRLMDRLFRNMTEMRQTIDRLRADNQHLSLPFEGQIEAVRAEYEGSLSMRIGRILTWPLRWLLQLFRGK